MALLMAELPFMQIAFLPPLLPPFDASLITRLGCVPIRHSASHPSASDAAAAGRAVRQARSRRVPSAKMKIRTREREVAHSRSPLHR